MKNHSVITLFVIVLFALTQPAYSSPQEVDSAKIANELKLVNAQYGRSFEIADSSLFIDCYTNDACLMPANSPVICGRSGQLAFYQLAFRSGVRNIVFLTSALYGLNADTVTEQGSYEMYDANKKRLGKGKYLVVWRKTSRGWKMYRDMFNSDEPTPARKS